MSKQVLRSEAIARINEELGKLKTGDGPFTRALIYQWQDKLASAKDGGLPRIHEFFGYGSYIVDELDPQDELVDPNKLKVGDRVTYVDINRPHIATITYIGKKNNDYCRICWDGNIHDTDECLSNFVKA